jgi:hypothetical protein
MLLSLGGLARDGACVGGFQLLKPMVGLVDVSVCKGESAMVL